MLVVALDAKYPYGISGTAVFPGKLKQVTVPMQTHIARTLLLESVQYGSPKSHLAANDTKQLA